jgi:hypothetical protein
MSAKMDNVRVVTFKERYLSKSGKVLFEKGRTIAMHQRTVRKLEARGAKVDVKPFDEKKERAKLKARLEENDN